MARLEVGAGDKVRFRANQPAATAGKDGGIDSLWREGLIRCRIVDARDREVLVAMVGRKQSQEMYRQSTSLQ